MKKFDVKVNTTRGYFGTNYEVIGPKAQCEAWLDNLKKSFHPAGYGTYGKFITNLPNGEHVMAVYRANSCD